MAKWNLTIWVLPLKNLELKKIYHNPNYVMEYVHKVKLARLKKGMIYPSSILLYQLSERLGIDPNNIFALTQNKKIKICRKRKIRNKRLLKAKNNIKNFMK